MKALKKTNTAFTTPSKQLMLTVPEGTTLTVDISADGKYYESLGEAVTGPDTVQVNDIVPGTWFKLTSEQSVDVPVIL